jgi:hypothetical protein
MQGPSPVGKYPWAAAGWYLRRPEEWPGKEGKEMVNRREFVKMSTVTLLLIPVTKTLSGCGGSSPAPSAPTCDGVSSVSSTTLSHNHILCVLASDLATPPAGGVTYTTSLTGGHAHMVTLTQQDLQNINAGQVVTTTTTTIDGHTHDFSVQKGSTARMDGGNPYPYGA